MTSIAYLEEKLKDKDIQAALMTIRKCEGTDAQDGYRYLFGSRPDNALRFTEFTTHPNIRKEFKNGKGERLITTAAGAYQIIYPTFVMLCKGYGFTNFEPHTQDLMAVALFDCVNMLNAVSEGKFFDPHVLDGLNDQWASLPGAGYNQPEKSIATVKEWYKKYGGTVTA